MKSIFKLFLFFFGVLLTFSANAQYEYNLIEYTIKDGLPSDLIYDILQDKDGFLWFATDKGVAKFDGYNFKVFTTKDGLPNNDVWSLFEDSQGRIFVLTFFKGIVYIENDKIKTITDSRIQEWTISAPYIEVNSKIWIRLGQELLSLKGDKLTIEKKSNYKKNFFPPCYLYQESDDEYYIYRYKVFKDRSQPNQISLVHFKENEKTKEEILLQSEMPIHVFNNFSFKNKDGFYFWTTDHIYQYRFDTQTLKSIDLNQLNDNPNRKVNYLGDYIWKIDNQIFIIESDFNIKDVFKFTIPNNIKSSGKIFRDLEENLWIITSDRGVVCITKQSQQTNQFRPKHPNVNKIIVDKDDNIFYVNNIQFFPSRVDELYLLNNNHINTKINVLNTPISLSTLTISDNKLFLTRAGGAMKEDFIFLNKESLLKNQDRSFPKKRYYFPANQIKQHARFNLPQLDNFVFTNENNLSVKDVAYNTLTKNYWFSHHGGVGVFEYKKNTKSYSYRYQSIIGRTYALANRNKTIWLGQTTGLYFADEDALLQTKEPYEGVIKVQSFQKKINDLALDSLNRLWIGTDGYGVYVCEICKGEDFKLIEETSSDIVQELFAKNENEVWVATANGLKQIIVESWQPFKTSVKTFNTTHGLPTRVINTVFVKDSMAYVGTREGITMLPISKYQSSITHPLLHFTNVSINQLDTILSDSYTLRHDKNNIEITYVALSYKSQKNIIYRYRMKEIDKYWRTTSSLERVYPQLKAGKYIFELQAIDLNGLTSSNKSITFVILKPWWQTYWFYFILIVLVVGSIYLFFQGRFQQLAKEEAKRRTIDKKFAELELQALQAQMNPHFIFNSLTAIQHFILDNNIEAADEYLVKFSRLMRAFLDSSKEKYIRIDEELKLLKLYVELEQLRFKDKFNVIWNIDDDIDTYAELPSILIQPFIENAINHGLNYKKEKGLLEITFAQIDDSTISCTIKDNGVGRENAKNIQKQSKKNHKSRGMQIIEERLSTLEAIQDAPINIQITDLLEDEVSVGTQVDITIKVIDEN